MGRKEAWRTWEALPPACLPGFGSSRCCPLWVMVWLSFSSCLVHLADGLGGLLRQPGRVGENGGGDAEVSEGVQDHWGGGGEERTKYTLLTLAAKKKCICTFLICFQRTLAKPWKVSGISVITAGRAEPQAMQNLHSSIASLAKRHIESNLSRFRHHVS